MHAFSGLEGSPGFGNRSQKVPSSLDWNTGSSINLIRICSDLYPHLAAAHCRSFFGQSQHVQVHVVLASSAQTEAEAFTVSLQVHGVQLPILNTHTHTIKHACTDPHVYKHKRTSLSSRSARPGVCPFSPTLSHLKLRALVSKFTCRKVTHRAHSGDD